MTVNWMLSDTAPALRKMEAEVSAVTLTRTQKGKLREAAKKWVDMSDPTPYSPDVVTQTMTHLYLDPANSFIPFGQVLSVSLMRLRGEQAAEVTRELEILRRVADELYKTR